MGTPSMVGAQVRYSPHATSILNYFLLLTLVAQELFMSLPFEVGGMLLQLYGFSMLCGHAFNLELVAILQWLACLELKLHHEETPNRFESLNQRKAIS
jgi:hypothetical protein